MAFVAGIDCGSTLLKAHWVGERGAQSALLNGSDRDSMGALETRLLRDGVVRARALGTGARRLTLRGIDILRGDGDAIEEETRLQALGARLLLRRDNEEQKNLIVAAVGTGVSYTTARGSKTKRSPLGSCHGGGTIMGLARLLGVRDFARLCALASNGTSPDLLVKHKLPGTAGTPLGELIIAHFAREDASLEDNCAGIFGFAAASVFKDLAVLRSIPFSPKDIAIVGTVGASAPFKMHLQRFATALPKGTVLHFPKQAAFAAAMGAWQAARK